MIANILTIVAVIVSLLIGRYWGKCEVWKEIERDYAIVDFSEHSEPKPVKASRERLDSKDILSAEFLEVKSK